VTYQSRWFTIDFDFRHDHVYEDLLVTFHLKMVKPFFPAYENGVSLANIHRIVVSIVYVINHFNDSVCWIGQTPKIILKNGFVPPCPYVSPSR
jgi:hypothetical protein